MLITNHTMGSIIMSLTETNQLKRAEVFNVGDEDMLWDKNLLGDATPEQFFSNLVFYIGLVFSLRSGTKLRCLKFKPPQTELFVPPNDRAYLRLQVPIE